MLIRLCSGRSKFIVQPFEFLDFILVLTVFTINIIFYLQEDYTSTTKMILNRSSGSEAGLLIILLRLWRVQKIVQSLVDESKSKLTSQLILMEREKDFNDQKIDLLVSKIEDYEHETSYLKEKNKRIERDRNDLMNQLKTCAIVINNTHMNKKQVSTFPGRHSGNLGNPHCPIIFGGNAVRQSNLNLGRFDKGALRLSSRMKCTSQPNMMDMVEDQNDQDSNLYSNITLRGEESNTTSSDEDFSSIPELKTIGRNTRKGISIVKATIEPSNVSTFKPRKLDNQPARVTNVNRFAQVLAGRITSDVQNIISAKLVTPSSSSISSPFSTSQSSAVPRTHGGDTKSNEDTVQAMGSQYRYEEESKSISGASKMGDMRALNRVKRPQVTARKSLKQQTATEKQVKRDEKNIETCKSLSSFFRNRNLLIASL